MIDADVVVVGGGISGLMAARVLSGKGLSVRLYEAQQTCGGLIRTDRIGDWVIDAGPDTLLAHKPAALDLVRALGLEGRLVAPIARRPTYVLRRRALRTLPETSALGLPTDWRTLATARAFSWRGKLRMALEAFLPPGSPAGDESIGSFVGRRFGREAVTYVAEPLLAGIHRGDAASLSIRALFPLLADAERTHGSVCRAWRLSPRQQPAGGSMSLEHGLGELVASLQGQLPPGVVTTGAAVNTIAGKGPFLLRLQGSTLVSARAVVLATPAYATARLTAALDPALADLCGSIRYSASVNVAIGYRRAAIRHALDGWGFVVPLGEARRIRSASWVSSKWPGRAPAHHVLIRASLAERPDAPLDEQDDVRLAGWAHQDLSDLLDISDEPVLARVYRQPRAMPQLEVGHLQRMGEIERRLAALPGIHITASGFRGVGLPHCISDATDVAERVAYRLQM
jgi:protoporphyrinogen/coproporphyrinogen III oxidase